MKIEAKLKEMGLELPKIPEPIANYVPAARTGNLLFLSGHGPEKTIPNGKVGKELTLEQGYEAAKKYRPMSGKHHKEQHWRSGQGQAYCETHRFRQLLGRFQRSAEGGQRRVGFFRRSIRR